MTPPASSLLLPLAALALLGACHRETPEQRAVSDARAVAKVKAAQRMIPPAVPLTPQPVSFADLDAPRTRTYIPATAGKPPPGSGCGFVAANAADRRPVFVAVAKFGLMKRDGRLLTFAADSGSAERARGLRARYTSDALLLELAAGDALAGDAWKAALTVRDRYQRFVYFAAGEVRCHR